jgi:transcriptional regulator of heat shock response
MGRIRQDIMAGEPKDLLERMPSLGAAFRMLRKAFEWSRSPQQAWGQENLFRMQVGQDARHLYLLQQALAHPELLRRGLSAGRKVGGAQVALGTETGYEGLEPCALIGHSFGAGHWEGTLGVLGPMGMNYSHILEEVLAAARSLSDYVFARLAAAHDPGLAAQR